MPIGDTEIKSDKEFYQEACQWADCKNINEAKKWWNAFYEIFVHDLYFVGKSRAPKLGQFGVKFIPETTQKQKGKNGRVIMYTVPARTRPTFTPHDTFVNDINMHGVTKKYRRRLKNNEMKQDDIKRELRAEAIRQEKEAAKISPEQLNKTAENFKAYLTEKYKKYQKRLEAAEAMDEFAEEIKEDLEDDE